MEGWKNISKFLTESEWMPLQCYFLNRRGLMNPIWLSFTSSQDVSLFPPLVNFHTEKRNNYWEILIKIKHWLITKYKAIKRWNHEIYLLLSPGRELALIRITQFVFRTTLTPYLKSKIGKTLFLVSWAAGKYIAFLHLGLLNICGLFYEMTKIANEIWSSYISR